MVKDTPNHIPMNMISSAQTPRKILNNGVVPIFTVVLIAIKALRYSAPLWDHIIHILFGG